MSKFGSTFLITTFLILASCGGGGEEYPHLP